MSKATLIIDMPDSCRDCEFFGLSCKLTNKKCNHYDENGRAGHCPLSLLPEKDNTNCFPDEWEDGYVSGWNACLDTIFK